MVARERGQQFRLMKWLGDGAMLAYADASLAVAAAARIIDRARSDTGLSAHASVHCGPAIARDGDYFGGAVNLSARLLNAAGADEMLATRPVVESTQQSHKWEPAGERKLRGFSEPIEVFHLVLG
jgi:class 3 adenylate cyclase